MGVVATAVAIMAPAAFVDGGAFADGAVFADDAAAPVIALPGGQGGHRIADSAALRATVYGSRRRILPPCRQGAAGRDQHHMPWARPVPDVFWFGRDLRVWFSSQDKPPPLAIVISVPAATAHTGAFHPCAALYNGAGYHVLTMRPTFPGSSSPPRLPGWPAISFRTDMICHSAMQRVVAHLPGKGANHRHRHSGLQPGRRQRGCGQIDRRERAQAQYSPRVLIEPP